PQDTRRLVDLAADRGGVRTGHRRTNPRPAFSRHAHLRRPRWSHESRSLWRGASERIDRLERRAGVEDRRQHGGHSTGRRAAKRTGSKATVTYSVNNHSIAFSYA